MKTLLLGCVALMVYHYLLYPGLVIALAALRRRAQPLPALPALPRVSFVIAAYNEERVIAAKLRNTLDLDYPRELLELIVVSDGSSDRTPQIVGEFAQAGVLSMHQAQRRGKTAALNRAVERTSGEILVFSDANNDFSAQALRQLVRHFAEPSVGGVCGVKHIRPAEERQSSLGDGLYWRYEAAIKLAEARLGTITNADGEIFAMRRALYRPVDEKVINDDQQITFDMIAQGYRVLYEPAAQSFEYASISIRDDFFVKVRMVAGGFQAIARNWRVLFPPRSWFALAFLSHKVLRWLMPEALIATFAFSLLLAAEPLYAAFAGLQVLFYTAALCGYLLIGRNRSLPVFLYVPYYFCAMNLAALRGLLRYGAGWQTEHWHKAQR